MALTYTDTNSRMLLEVTNGAARGRLIFLRGDEVIAQQSAQVPHLIRGLVRHVASLPGYATFLSNEAERVANQSRMNGRTVMVNANTAQHFEQNGRYLTIATRFPAEDRQLIICTHRHERGPHAGQWMIPPARSVRIPERVWMVQVSLERGNRSLHVMGVKTSTGYMAWPYGNVYETGRVCWGNGEPEAAIINAAEIDALFWRSPFNSDLRHSRWPIDYNCEQDLQRHYNSPVMFPECVAGEMVFPLRERGTGNGAQTPMAEGAAQAPPTGGTDGTTIVFATAAGGVNIVQG